MSLTLMLILISPRKFSLTEAELTKAFDFAQSLAQEAGVIMKRYFQASDIGIQLKEDDSPVTVADHSINNLVIEKVRTHYPTHGVIGEEGSYESDRDWVWVVDPVDGTSPFSLGIPISTFCLALVHKGAVQLSVVFDPFQDRLFTAQKGKGAFLNGVAVHVSNTNTFKGQYVMTFRSLAKSNHTGMNRMFDALQKSGAKVYMFASFSYAAMLVAEGRLVASCMVYGSPWDAAAASLIVQEAGGQVTDMAGQSRDFSTWGEGLIMTNGAVHSEIISLIDYENTRD